VPVTVAVDLVLVDAVRLLVVGFAVCGIVKCGSRQAAGLQIEVEKWDALRNRTDPQVTTAGADLVDPFDPGIGVAPDLVEREREPDGDRHRIRACKRRTE
jgi:hypothetical protein